MRAFNRDKTPPLDPEVQNSISNFTVSQRFKTLNLEIGCGVGLHPILWAKDNPEHGLIALERTKEKFIKFSHRMQHHSHIKNVLPLHADARSVVTHQLADESIETIFLLYPNPEPKNKNQRWINMPFFSEFTRILKPHGQIEIRTNILAYAEEVKTLSASRGFTIHKYDSISSTNKPETHFEKKYLARNQICMKIVLKLSQNTNSYLHL
ncbi:MAG: tRNA (guanine(46)-N(7))-methyltransferase TrmB [Pseudobdellovibrio sp.]